MRNQQLLNKLTNATLAANLGAIMLSAAALAKDPLEAAQDLASGGQTDPNGLTLMIVSICMLFVFALSLIIATSVHAFKKKPARRQAHGVNKEPSVV